MNEHQFFKIVQHKAKEVNMDPLLLLSGIEAIYTFKDVPLNNINYDLLDSLIITIFTLRIGDQFHAMAEENLKSSDPNVQLAAINELMELPSDYVSTTSDRFFQSFAQMVGNKTTVRRYHEKALEVAALEVYKTQEIFGEKSIGIITLTLCKSDTGGTLDLGAIFNSA